MSKKTTITIPLKGVFLRYKTGDWMSIDKQSGYPYMSDFRNAANFQTVSKAFEYIDHFDDDVQVISTQCLTMAAEIENLPKVRMQEFQEKLANLKAEYGIE